MQILPGSSDDPLVINASGAFCNMAAQMNGTVRAGKIEIPPWRRSSMNRDGSEHRQPG
jgi:hypothetical protein